ncbi:hypothetical protein [Streptosporangium roseum]|uniref:hypothetical protein n=1 Tax=Streptosporangium roseum TaxID=2001 RepID=UPI00331C3741
MTGESLLRVKGRLRGVELALASHGFHRTHLPFVVPPSVVDLVRPWLAPGVTMLPITAGDSSKICGWLGVAGLCLQPLPMLASRQWSWRQLPLGYQFVSAAHGPGIDSRGTSEDVVCLGGAVAAAHACDHDDLGRDTLGEAAGAVEDVLRDLAPAAVMSEQQWCVTGMPARIWRVDGEIVGIWQELPGELVAKARIRYMNRRGALEPCRVALVYIGPSGLSASGSAVFRHECDHDGVVR